MTIADLDRDLARFRSAADTVSSNLLELEGDPNRQLLETAPLIGITAGEWADARMALNAVWDWFARLTAFLEHATELRASARTRLAPGREQLLAEYLTAASIELASDDVPMRDRGLLQQRSATSRCTAEELLTLMSDAFARAREVVIRVGAAWDELMPRVARARAELATISDVGAERVHEQLERLTEALVTDPLSVTEDAVNEAERSVATLNRSAAEALALRDDWSDKLRAARAELDRVEREVAEARAEVAATAAKIVDPAASDLLRVDATLVAALGDAAGLADAGRWDDAAVRLGQWHTLLQRRAEAAAAAHEASRASMTERDQLRGRLEAYRAKAHGVGLDEDVVVTDAYERAQAALYVAPADLSAARQLVARYQRLLTTTHDPEARR